MVSTEEQVIASGKHLRLMRHGTWEYTQRLNCSGVVVMAAVNQNQRLILVEQYRIPVRSYTIEMPAGLVGDASNPNEDLGAGAKRELLEETGYEAHHLETIISGPSSSGLTSEIHTLVFAHQLKKIALGGGIGKEHLSIHEVPLYSVYSWLLEQTKHHKLVDPKILAALYYISHMHPELLT